MGYKKWKLKGNHVLSQTNKTPKDERKPAKPNTYLVLANAGVPRLCAEVPHPSVEVLRSGVELLHFNCTIGIEVKGYLYLPLFFPNGCLPHSDSHQPVDKLSLHYRRPPNFHIDFLVIPLGEVEFVSG